MKKKRVIILIASIALVLSGSVLITAAFYAPNVTNSDAESVISATGASIGLTLTNGTVSKTITAGDIIPGWSDTKNFKVTISNAAVETKYLVYLNYTSDFDDGDLVYTLTSSDEGAINVTSAKAIKASSTLKSKSLGIGVFAQNTSVTTHNYVLTISYPETSTSQNGLGKTFNGYISIAAVDDNQGDKYAKITSYIDGVLADAFPEDGNYVTSITCTANGNTADASAIAKWDTINNKWIITLSTSDNNTECIVYFTTNTRMLNSTLISNSTVLTDWTTGSIPKTNNSLSDEAALYKVSSLANGNVNTEDDTGGESYVYRGAVENNYVKFANKCWRVVRIDGDNNIKLVLYSDNTSTVANPCSITDTGASFIGSGTFNGTTNRNTYVGFMYANSTNLAIADDTTMTDGERYNAEHSHDLDSNVLKKLKVWYNTYFVNATDGTNKYQDYLADVVWCNDITTTAKGYGTNETKYYGYQNRTYPTLNCNSELSKYDSDDYAIDTTNNVTGAEYKIGLLTADEIVFAGATGYENKTYYLYKNANSSRWWTMSPYHFSGTAFMFIMYNENYLTYFNGLISNKYSYRPSVSLKSTVKIAPDGDGTASNTYVVNGF